MITLQAFAFAALTLAGVWAAHGETRDRFIRSTESAIEHEKWLVACARARASEAASCASPDGQQARLVNLRGGPVVVFRRGAVRVAVVE
jgi:hypothetical protein